MLPPMFGMGGSEILVILVVALLFLGPEKLPEAASKISKGIRDLRKQTRELTQTIENDTEIGGAIRDLKSALRGDEPRAKIQPRPAKKEPPKVDEGDKKGEPVAELPVAEAPAAAPAEAPASAPGEADAEAAEAADAEDDGAAALIRAPSGTVAKGAPAPAPAPSSDDEQKAG
jgi:sec-independent protein translocase protein TatB